VGGRNILYGFFTPEYLAVSAPFMFCKGRYTVMQKQIVRKAIAVGVVAGILAIAAGALSAAPSYAEQQKTAVKKSVRKDVSAKKDAAPAVVLPSLVQDSLTADTALMAAMLFTLKIVTEPESVSVLLDDSLKGFSPCTLSGVAPGGHVLTLKKSGYYLKKAEITVDSATPRDLSFVLLKPAFLRVTSNPTGALLSIDGTNEGTTPYENDKVKPGDHTIKVERRQFTAAERAIAVKNGGRDTVHFSLEHTQVYRDSVVTALRTAEKLRKDRFTFTIVSALFSLCAILLIVIEANNN
jgi:hypothetical protein